MTVSCQKKPFLVPNPSRWLWPPFDVCCAHCISTAVAAAAVNAGGPPLLVPAPTKRVFVCPQALIFLFSLAAFLVAVMLAGGYIKVNVSGSDCSNLGYTKCELSV